MTFKTMKACSKAYKEDNDCTVIALAIGGGISYDLAHKIMKANGRKKGKGALNHSREKNVPLNNAFNSLGFTLRKVPQKTIKSKSLMALTRDIKTKETLIVYTGGWRGPNHVTVYKNGVCEDWAAQSRKRIISVYLVRKEN